MFTVKTSLRRRAITGTLADNVLDYLENLMDKLVQKFLLARIL